MTPAIIKHKTLDLVDAIENRGLTPIWIEGAVGCFIAKGSDMEGLPKAACCIQYFPQDEQYKVWWPDFPWTEDVQNYVEMIDDASGVANATLGA
jgi:hypothetical protein